MSLTLGPSDQEELEHDDLWSPLESSINFKGLFWERSLRKQKALRSAGALSSNPSKRPYF